MTDQLPYTYTDDEDVAVRVGPRVCTVYDRPGRTSVGFYTPAGEDAVRLARAVLAAAGDTGHWVVSAEGIREERHAAGMRDALSMRERAAQQLEYTPPIDSPPEHAALKAAYADAIRALPLLPDGDTTEGAITDALDAQLPGRNGDVVNDIRIALDTRVDLTPEHRAFYSEIINRFEGLAADRDQARRTRNRYRNERDEARRWGRILDRTHIATGHEQRLAALEQQYTDLANLVHGHGEDIVRLNQAGVDVSADVSRMLKATRKARRYGAGEDG